MIEVLNATSVVERAFDTVAFQGLDAFPWRCPRMTRPAICGEHILGPPGG